MSPKQLNLAELKALREGITPGPWKVERSGFKLQIIAGIGMFVSQMIFKHEGEEIRGVREDANFIALSPSILDQLISLLEWKEALRGKIEGMKVAVRKDEDGYWNAALSTVSALLEDKEK